MIGTTVSHYRIISHLGAGGMGTVYLAEDLSLQRKVALKFLTPHAVPHPEAGARLRREARAASALDHAHIATIYEIGEAGGQPFMAMAHYEGETLAARLARGPLTYTDSARILSQVADALAAAHAAGIVHRDLKPSNVMITTAGQVKILDFGIAKLETTAADETSARLTAEGVTVGTTGYMPPEQAAGQPVDARADLWSLGVVAYEMITGRLPFAGNNVLEVIQAILTTTPTPVREVRPDVPSELEGIVGRTLVREVDRRTVTAAEIRDQASALLVRLTTGSHASVPIPRARRRLIAGAVVLTVLAIGSAGAWWIRQNAKVRWAREKALPEVIRLAGEDRFDAAFALATNVQRLIPNDPILAEQMRLVSRTGSVTSEPAGADVYYRPYGRTGEPWRHLGRTPLEKIVVPRGLLHWKLELAGHGVAEDVGPGPFWPPRFHFKLVPEEQVPDGMVRVTASSEPFSLFIPGLDHLPEVALADYWIDRIEVTNRQFKAFVVDGGYRRPEFWREAFTRDGRTLGFHEAMALFRDATGTPGPSTWELGSYPAGQDDFPVAGVSWFEAAAFARWAGKSLPTVYHWARAADQRISAEVIPASNFRGKGLLAAGTSGGITRSGTHDMGGNVKEWCANAGGDKRYILGGAWNEPHYMFTDADAQSPFARNATFGFRLVKADREADLAGVFGAPIEFPSRDVRKIKPAADAVFQAWRSLYSYDRGDLKAKVESVDDSSADWRMEKVSYAAAYGDERIPAYLFLPKNASPPFQTVLFFPGSGTLHRRDSATGLDFDRISWVVRSGRALLYPVYKSTFERGDVIASDYPSKSAVWRDHMIMWSKDVGRSVDYLESRPDVARDRIAYLGYSWGAGMAPLFLALEPRLKVGLLMVGGFYLQDALPEADPVHFAPRVTVPVLMLNGRFDFFFPTDSSQEPMFNMLGTPAEHKRRVVYETSHTIPRTETIRENVAWLDKYLGPVK